MTSCHHNDGFLYSHAICSGHDCLVDGQCYCDNGWITYMEFSQSSSYDCDISSYFIQSICALIALISLLSCLYIVSCMRHEKLWVVGKRYKEKNILYTSYLIMGISGIANAIRCIDPKRVVGIDPLLTIINLIICLCFICGITAYCLSLVKFIKGYTIMIPDPTHRDRINAHFSVLRLFFYRAPGSYIIAYSIIFLASLGVIDNNAELFNIIYLCVLSLSFICYLGPISYLYHIFISEMNHIAEKAKARSMTPPAKIMHSNNSANNDTSMLLKKVKIVSAVHITFMILGGIAALIFLCWSQLRTISVYLNIMLLLYVMILSPMMIWSVAVPVDKVKPPALQIKLQVNAMEPSAPLSMSSNIKFQYTPSAFIANRILPQAFHNNNPNIRKYSSADIV